MYYYFFFRPFLPSDFSSILKFLPDRPQSEQETNSSEPPVFLFSLASPRQKSQYGLGAAFSLEGSTLLLLDAEGKSKLFSGTNTGIGGSSIGGGGWVGKFGGRVGGAWGGIVGCVGCGVSGWRPLLLGGPTKSHCN